MPGGDKTGPAGQGPMTGRGAGYCTGSRFGYSRGRFDKGWRQWGRGGLGRRNRFYATELTGWQQTGPSRPGRRWPFPPDAPPATRQAAVAVLTAQITELADALQALGQRIESMEAETKRH